MKRSQAETAVTITSTSKLKQIISAIPKLRQPIIADREIDNKKTVICLQKEYILTSAAETRFVGTKDLHQCIALYFFSNKQSFFIHCDASFKSKDKVLIKRLGFFTGKKINLMILGGYECEASNSILSRIIEELIEAASELSIEIIITHQKIIRANQFSEEDKPLFIYNKLFEKIEMLHRYLFNQRIDISKLGHLKVEHLLQSFDKLNENQLILLVGIIVQTSAFMRSLSIIGLNCYKKNYAPGLTAENFYDHMKMLFCKKAFDMFDKAYSKSQSYNRASLTEFVIDSETRTVTPIPKHFTTPNESLRTLTTLFQTQPYRSSCSKPRLTQDVLKPCFGLIKKKFTSNNKRNPIIPKLDYSHFNKEAIISGSIFQIGMKFLFSIQDNFLNNLGKKILCNKKTKSNENTASAAHFLFFVITNILNINYIEELSKIIEGNTLVYSKTERGCKVWLRYSWLEQLSTDALNELAFGIDNREGAGISRWSLYQATGT